MNITSYEDMTYDQFIKQCHAIDQVYDDDALGQVVASCLMTVKPGLGVEAIWSDNDPLFKTKENIQPCLDFIKDNWDDF